MNTFPVSDLLRSINSLGNLAHSITEFCEFSLSVENRGDVLRHCETVKMICDNNKLDNCSISAEKLLKIIHEGVNDVYNPMLGMCYRWNKHSAAKLKNYANELGSRVCDTLSMKDFIEINRPHALITNELTKNLSEDNLSRFSGCFIDISEADICFSLGRYTACVFHLMRAMEASIPVICDILKVNYKDQNGQILNWGILLSNIKNEVDKMKKGVSQDRWYKINTILHSFNRGYRVKIAHPGQAYNEDEAANVFISISSYFKELSEVLE